MFHDCRRERVTASGGEVGRLSIVGGAQVCILVLKIFSRTTAGLFFGIKVHDVPLSIYPCYFTLCNMQFLTSTDWSPPLLARGFMPF